VLIDLPLHELRALRPSLPEPEGFADFWSATLAAARLHPIQVQRTPWHVQLPHVCVDDVTFRGYGGQPVRAWFLRPAAATGALPCIVTYEGYGGGRGLPHEWLFWTAAGASVLVVDNRGQGSGHRVGATADVAPPSGPHSKGFLTLASSHRRPTTTGGCSPTRCALWTRPFAAGRGRRPHRGDRREPGRRDAPSPSRGWSTGWPP
jgi:cephalosporin-C deacetylase